MNDVFFIAYDEPNAKKNFMRLKQFSSNVKSINNIKGILNAHKLAAEKSSTEWFFVVDADAYIVDNFCFHKIENPTITNEIRVWRSKNNVNDLVYGYGGVKLLSKSIFAYVSEFDVDMTSSLPSKYVKIDDIASVSMFNSSPFHAWRAAFRECVKLSIPLNEEKSEARRRHRLSVWLNVGGTKEYGEWCIQGAHDGVSFYNRNSLDLKLLNLINDYEFLDKLFKKKSHNIYKSNSDKNT